MESYNMHGGTNKKIIDLFSQNMNTICVFRLKNLFSNYNGYQYTGTLLSIYNSIDRFDVLSNASIILNGIEYEGTIGLIRKYLHEANTISDMINSGMLIPSGPKFISYDNLNLPLDQLFKQFGNEIILKLHAFRTSGKYEQKIEIITYLNNFKNKLIMIPGDQYSNLQILCDNAISEIGNINENSIVNYIGEIKNQFVNIFNPIVNPTMILINNSIESSIGNPPNFNTLTAANIYNSANRLRIILRAPVPHNIPNNLNKIENIYLFYYNVVEKILNITLDGFDRVAPPLPPPNNFEAAVVAGVDAILQSHGNNTIDNIFPFDKHALCVLFGGAIPPAIGIPIPIIQHLFLYNPQSYLFLGNLCANIPNPIINIDILTDYVIGQFLNTPHGSQLNLAANAPINPRLGGAYAHFVRALPPRYSYSYRPLIDIFNGITILNIPLANINNEMYTLYAINIASMLFTYIHTIEYLLEIVNNEAINLPVGFPNIAAIHSYNNYPDLYGFNGANYVDAVAAVVAIGLPLAPATGSLFLGGILPPAILPIIPPPLVQKDIMKNRINTDIHNEIILAKLSAVVNADTTAEHLRQALDKIFDIISIIKDENIHMPILSEMKNLIDMNTHIINNSNNLSEIGNSIHAIEQNINNMNDALTNAIILPPTNINIYSKEIELLLIQLLAI